MLEICFNLPERYTTLSWHMAPKALRQSTKNDKLRSKSFPNSTCKIKIIYREKSKGSCMIGLCKSMTTKVENTEGTYYIHKTRDQLWRVLMFIIF